MRTTLTLLYVSLVCVTSAACCRWCPARPAQVVTVERRVPCLSLPPPDQLPFAPLAPGEGACTVKADAGIDGCLTAADDTAIQTDLAGLRHYAADAWSLCNEAPTSAPASRP